MNAVSPCNGTLPPVRQPCCDVLNSLSGVQASPTPLPGMIVFKPELEKGVACYRIPAVMQTTNGTLIAFAEARCTIHSLNCLSQLPLSS